MRKIGLRTGVLAVAMMMAAPAMAQPTTGCSPSAVATSDQQVSAWDKADLVVVAQIAERRTISLPGLPDAPQVSLAPMTWLKGAGSPWQFGLGVAEMTSCGPVPGFDAISGKVGDEFVIFVKGDDPAQATIFETVSLKALVEPRALAALKAAE
jgi:hypothetical protein